MAAKRRKPRRMEVSKFRPLGIDWDDVLLVKKRHLEDGMTVSKLARELDCSRAAVHDALKRRDLAAE